MGVALIYAKSYSAASKGKIERLWRTVRTQLLPLKRFLEHIELIRPAPRGLSGKRVLLLYHEQDPQRIEVICDNRSQGFLTPLNPQVNARVRRAGGRDVELIPPEEESARGQHNPDDLRYRDGQLFSREDHP